MQGQTFQPRHQDGQRSVAPLESREFYQLSWNPKIHTGQLEHEHIDYVLPITNLRVTTADSSNPEGYAEQNFNASEGPITLAVYILRQVKARLVHVYLH